MTKGAKEAAELTQLEEIILAFVPLMADLSAGLIEGLANARRPIARELLGRYMVIRLCGFLSEWELLQMHRNNPKVKALIYTADPILERIRKRWPGLITLRNHMFAHSTRRKDRRLAFTKRSYYKDIRAPSSVTEWFLLAELAVLAMHLATLLFHDEWESGRGKILEGDKDSHPDDRKPQGITTLEEYKMELSEVKAAVAARQAGIEEFLNPPLRLTGIWSKYPCPPPDGWPG